MKKRKNITPWFYFIKCEWNHRLGNVIGTILQIVDNTITIVTLGFLYSNLHWKWTFFRLSEKGKFFYGKSNR